MRRALRALYTLCGYLAGVALVLMLAMILLNIAGGVFGFFIQGLDAYAGYLMAASIFLSLAYTLKAGEHIRVTLVIERLSGRARKAFELFCLAAATVITGYVAWFAVRMVWLSWLINDISQAQDQTPLWIPQTVMAFGAVILFIAFVEDLVDEIRGRRVLPKPGDEPLHIE